MRAARIGETPSRGGLLWRGSFALLTRINNDALQRVRAGHEAEIAFDAIPGRVFKGKVKGIMNAVVEGQLRPTGALIDPETRQDPGRALAQVEITDDLSEYQLPAGSSRRGLVDHQGTPRGDDPPPLRITRAGLEAIGVEPEDTGSDTASAEADTGATPADAGAQAVEAPAPATRADGAAMRAKRNAKTAKSGKAAPAKKATPRAGTKQARMIEMLKRPEGATVEQIAAATGWQKHTIRGAISGALKKKLGLTVEAVRTRAVGPNKAGAKGSSTVYRIPGPATGPEPANGSGTETA